MLVTVDDVQYALRNLNCEQRLGDSRIVRYLLRTSKTRTFREAIIATVQGAFQASGDLPESVSLRDLLYKYDIENSVPRLDAAKNLGMSYRNFFRKRSQAIKIVVDYINGMSRGGTNAAIRFASHEFRQQRPMPVSSNHAKPLAPPPESGFEPFESFRNRFETARMRGDVFAMEDSLAILYGRRKKLTEHQALESDIIQAELKLYLGQFSQSSILLDSAFERLTCQDSSRLWLFALVVAAQLAFTLGNLGDAESLAETVQNSPHTDESSLVRSTLLLGRISATAGTPWPLGSLSATTDWERLSINAIRARHDCVIGRYEDARTAALETKARALDFGFLPLASYCAATIAGCYRDRDVLRAACVAESLRLLAASSCNAFTARDLFQFGSSFAPSSAWLHESIDTDIAAIYLGITPASAFRASAALRECVSGLIRIILSIAANPDRLPESSQSIEDLTHRIAATGQLGGTLSNEHPDLARFGEFLKVVNPLVRQASFSRSFSSAAGHVVRAIARLRSYENIRALSVVS